MRSKFQLQNQHSQEMILQSLTKSLILGILLLHLSFESCSSETSFIRSSENSNYSAQSCFTLNEFVVNTIDKDIEAEICPGNHSVSALSDFQNIMNFSMFSVKKNSTIITCSKSAGFRFHNISVVRLTNLTFIGCGSNYALLQNISDQHQYQYVYFSQFKRRSY